MNQLMVAPARARAMLRRGAALARATAPLVALALMLAGCAATGRVKKPRLPGPADAATTADSATVLAWHFDETSGVRMADESPAAIDGAAGADTRAELGRIHGARGFSRSIESFIWAPYQPAIETANEMTIEAWIRLDAFGQYEDTPIASRWNPNTADQCWIFAVGGRNLQPPLAALASPGDYAALLPTGFQNRTLGRLMFAFQGREAGPARAYFSNQPIELERWTHVAATCDGKVVRFYLDGRLDSQYAIAESIRPSQAPLLVGNAFDPRALTGFGGDLRVGIAEDRNPYYAFEGAIDELRLSNVARTEFPYVR